MTDELTHNAVLIHKQTGQTIYCKVDESLFGHIMDDSFEDESEGEPMKKALMATATFTIKNQDARKLKRLFRPKNNKYSRKLKNALRHIEVIGGQISEEESNDPYSLSVRQNIYIRTKDGYPTTKWVRRAYAIITKQYDMIMKGATT